MRDAASQGNQLRMQDFYWLRYPGSLRAYEPDRLGLSYQERHDYSKGEAVPAEPLRIAWSAGSMTPEDLVWIGVKQFVASPRCLEVLAGFTGWRTYPVEVYDGGGMLVPGYAAIAVTGRCGRVLSDLTREEGEGIRANYVGLVFSPNEWDGSDIFFPLYGVGPIATASLREAMRSAKITNLRATQLTKVRLNKGMVDRMRTSRTGAFTDWAGEPIDPA